ncbi:hypothetical protein WA026_016192 [Henosepilachna vigintioctopunctata]|uniref:Ig-like domain-containing protein n=1 Tax=Henosepilachna vigintioctopunctata TaxID=420089 RepID=A0AAW1TPA9_9CUCU
MYPINYLFKNSLSPEYVYIRENLKLSLELKSDWESWGPCEVCGRDEIFLFNAFEVSCRSLLLKKLTPTIFNSTRIVPDFTEIHHCEGICNPDAEGANAGWKVGKAKSYKYRKTVVMSDGDHLTLICPESTLENNVVWKKNGMELKRGESVKPEKFGEEPRILVDTFSTLYLVEVTSTEEGNYTCLVDNIKMEQVIIFIVSKSRLFSALFVRHLLYLGFVLSLTLTCYIGGVVVACKKRYTFKTYKILKNEAKESGTEDSDDEEEDSF